MDRRGMTVSKLAAQTGVSSKTIYGWLAGNPPRHLDDLFAVARVLRSTIEELAFAQHNDSERICPSVALGGWLRLCRERMRMSQQEVSNRLELRPDALIGYEDGEDIPMSVVLKLTRLYQVDKAVLSAKLAGLL